MKLAYWMYAGPAHIGTLRVASSFKNVHAVMHAPLGDDYFNVLRSMLERERDFTPVTASMVDRHVLARGSQEKVVENIVRKDKEERPDLILLTPTCTSSILQEDLQNFVNRASNQAVCDVILADVNHYRVNELQAADRTLEQIVRFYIEKAKKESTLMFGNNFKSINQVSDSNMHQNLKNGESIVSTLLPLPHSALVRSAKPSVVGSTLCSPEGVTKPMLPTEELGLHVRAWRSQTKAKQDLESVKYQDVNYLIDNSTNLCKTEKPSANILGIFTLGFHNQHDSKELKKLLNDLNIEVNEIIPEGGNLNNLKNLPKAWFNIVPYREVGLMTAVYLEKEFNMPYTSITPMGLVNTAAFIKDVASICEKVSKSLTEPVSNQNNAEVKEKSFSNIKILNKVDWCEYVDKQTHFVSQAAWFSRSIDCQNLTGKKTVVFGDATHAACITKILVREMGIHVMCAGTYCKNDADWFREEVEGYCDKVLITDDHSQIGEIIEKLEPAAIFGTQMERHVGKRLNIPCGVISAPVHIQNFPLGYRPFLGYEGTNQISDLVYNSFNLGMEDHLLEIFVSSRPEESSTPLLPSGVPAGESAAKFEGVAFGEQPIQTEGLATQKWTTEALNELNKVPGFVRAKVKRNTEKYAQSINAVNITVEIMYAAKEAVSSSSAVR